MSEQKAELWPLDFGKLQKGDVILSDEIERILATRSPEPVNRGTDSYNLGLLNIIGQIERRRPDLRVKRLGFDIKVLVDEEYAEHDRRRVRSANRKVLKTTALPAPDLTKLTAEGRIAWDRTRARTLRHAEGILMRERELRAEQKVLAGAATRPRIPR